MNRARTTSLLALVLASTTACSVADAAPRPAINRPPLAAAPRLTSSAAIAPSLARSNVDGPTTLTAADASALTPAEEALAGVLYIDNCGELVQRPTEVVLTCADAGLRLTHLDWVRWGAAEATSPGAIELNPCAPTCAESSTRSYRVVVLANGVARGEASARYTNLVVEFTGEVAPGHEQRENFLLAAPVS